MPDLIVKAGSCIESKATETFHLSEGDPTMYEDTHNLHRQAEKIKETIAFRQFFSSHFSGCVPPNETGASPPDAFFYAIMKKRLEKKDYRMYSNPF